MPATAGQPLPCADRWQMLHLAHLLRGQRLHLSIWHRVSGQGGRSGTLHPAGQSSDRGAAGGAEQLAATAASLFGLSPDSQ